MQPATSFDPDVLATLLTTRALGRTVRALGQVPSTQDVAFQLAQSGAAHGTLVLAEEQTRGKGRKGRSWVSPPGVNLYLSLILRPNLPPARAPEMTLVAAVAACEAVRALGAEAWIKWPNDLQIRGKKVAGMLTELSADPSSVQFVILGIGLDVNMEASAMPDEIAAIATSLRIELGRSLEREKVCAALMERLEEWFERHEAEGFEPVRRRWTELSSTIGQRVRVALDPTEVRGVAEGIDAGGALLVRTESGSLERIVSGDVESLRSI